MPKKLNLMLIQTELERKGITIFSPIEFQRIFDVSSGTASSFIFENTQRNLFIKLKNGLYALASRPPSELVIANRLYKPSYISFEYALSFYHIIPETVYTITSATTKSTREFEVLDKTYKYYRIKREAFGGYEPKKIQDTTCFMAEPEKALADYLYFVDLKKKTLLERISTKDINKKKLLDYAKLFNRPSLIKLTKSII